MPEGDMVWRTARLLDEALAGRVLTHTDFRVPRFATTDLTGRAVTETVSRGKHLLTRVDGGLTVHTHLRMDGSWRIRPAGGYPPRDHRIRLVLGNDARQALGYQLGVVEVLRTRSEERVVGHLGPDLLGPDWDAAEAVHRLQADPDRPAGEALLDQRNLAGIGNLYKSEVLFLRGLHPWRPVGSIDDLEALVELARRLLEANKDQAGQITTGNPARGQETWVYGRPGRPCRRCGAAIRTARHAGQRADPEDRVTFWCPRCQLLPAVSGRRSRRRWPGPDHRAEDGGRQQSRQGHADHDLRIVIAQGARGDCRYLPGGIFDYCHLVARTQTLAFPAVEVAEDGRPVRCRK
jgi:endonuclease-8